MESAPTPTQKQITPEERRDQIALLQHELQSLPQNDQTRPIKIKALISLLKEEEGLENGEVVAPEEAYHMSGGGDAFADTILEQPLFVRKKEGTD